MSDHKPDVAADVRAALGRARLRQSEVATATGINPSRLSRRLAGENDITVLELIEIAEVLDTTAVEIVPALATRRPQQPALEEQAS